MTRVLITGANGQLGSDLKELSKNLHDTEFTFIDVEELDITNPVAISAYFSNNAFQYLINCAAYTAVDKAENDKETAFKVNAEAVNYLISEIQKFQTKFIHISTDYVFKGDHNSSHAEDFQVDPQSVYGKSKLAGEKFVLQYPNGMIIRTAWLYSSYGHNFVKSILKKGRENKELRVVNDQLGSPTYSGHLAKAILKIVNHDLTKSVPFKPGIFHYTNTGVCSWFDFAVKIKEFANLPCRVIPISTDQYPLPAKRPAYSILSKDKIMTSYKLMIPDWKTGLKDCLIKLDELK
jgi:dTDP-4-dehydrorhamnose reductase